MNTTVHNRKTISNNSLQNYRRNVDITKTAYTSLRHLKSTCWSHMRSLMSRSTSIATSIGSCGIAKDNATALSLVDVIDSQTAQTTIQKKQTKNYASCEKLWNCVPRILMASFFPDTVHLLHRAALYIHLQYLLKKKQFTAIERLWNRQLSVLVLTKRLQTSRCMYNILIIYSRTYLVTLLLQCSLQ